jgi:hypothetical protein
MKNPNSSFLRRFVLSLAFGTLASCALHAQMVLFSDTFTGATTTPNPATLPAGGSSAANSPNITSNAGYTYKLYGSSSTSDPTTFSLGISGGDLTWGATQGSGLNANGIDGPTFATNFTPGSVTATELESLTFSFNYAFSTGVTGTNFQVSTDGTGSVNSTTTVLESNGASGTENITLNATTAQSFANAMNTADNSTLTLGFFSNSGSSFAPTGSSSITFSDLLVTTSVPEPSTYALLLGGAALLFGVRRLRRATI